MATKIRLALQGGGAKLVSCLAAMRAVERLSREHIDQNGNKCPPLIEVTQIAGTSAGSIAAVVFAAGVPMQTVLTYLSAQDPKRVFPKRPRWPLLTAAMGRAVIDGQALLQPHIANLLTQGARVARHNPPPQTFNELEIPAVVVVSDLLARRALKRTGAEPLIQSVIDSCSIPFILKNVRTANNAQLVDGGLCANLPAEISPLSDDEETLCFSYVPDPPDVADTTPKYALAALFTAIDSHVARIRDERRDFVHEIETSIKTLDFEKAVGQQLVGLNLELQGIETKAEAFIRRAVEKIEAEREHKKGRIAAIAGDPWMAALEGDGPIADHLVKSMREHYRLHAINAPNCKLRYVQSHLHVVGHSLLALNGRSGESVPADYVNTETIYEVAEGVLSSHAVAMGLAAANLFKTTPEIQIFRDGEYRDVDPGEVFNVAALSDTEEKHKIQRFMLICFRTPLPAGTRFKFTVKDEVGGMVAKLLEAKEDDLFINPTRKSTKDPDLIEISVAFPRLLAKRVTMFRHGEMDGHSAGRLMTDDELRERQLLAPNGYRCQGWRWEGVPVRDRYIVGLRLSNP